MEQILFGSEVAKTEKACSTELIAVMLASISSYLHKTPQEFAIISVLPPKTVSRSEWVTAGRYNLLEKGRTNFPWRKGRKL